MLTAALRGRAGVSPIRRLLSTNPYGLTRGLYSRKFALLTSACAVLLFSAFAYAQTQVDLLVGGSTLESSAKVSDSANFTPLVEKNGIYVSIGGDFVGFRKRHNH